MRRNLSIKWKREISGWLFASPWIIGLILFNLVPLIYSLFLSLTKYPIIGKPQFIGFTNYREIFIGEDTLFWQSLKVTATYVVMAIPLNLSLGLFLALLANLKIRGISWVRLLYYIPIAIPPIVSAILWKWILTPDLGLLNYYLEKFFGIKGPTWFYSEEWAIPAFVLINLWTVGYTMIIYLAGLQSIPQALYEAAEIDGASSWRRLWNITIPMMTPYIFFTLILGIISSFQIFGPAYIMTQGGPNNATLFYVFYLYRAGFQWFKMGYASALAWVLAIILIIITLAQFRVAKKWVYSEI